MLLDILTEKTAITAADLRNYRVGPFYAPHGIAVQRVLTGRGTEYCGKLENHAYQLYLAVEGIDHTKTKTNNPQPSAARITSSSAPRPAARPWQSPTP